MSAVSASVSDWGARAACRDEGDPEIFFPVGGRDSMTPLALSICSGCPVKSECLEEALRCGYDHGIWGGLDEVQRRAMHRARLRGAV